MTCNIYSTAKPSLVCFLFNLQFELISKFKLKNKKKKILAHRENTLKLHCVAVTPSCMIYTCNVQFFCYVHKQAKVRDHYSLILPNQSFLQSNCFSGSGRQISMFYMLCKSQMSPTILALCIPLFREKFFHCYEPGNNKEIR